MNKIDIELSKSPIYPRPATPEEEQLYREYPGLLFTVRDGLRVLNAAEYPALSAAIVDAEYRAAVERANS